MDAEFAALQRNRTWRLVDRPKGANVVSGKWLFKHKLNSDGSLERYKARWAVRGFTQRAGVDFGETFSPVVKPATIRTVSLLLFRGAGQPNNLMCLTHSFMDIFKNMFYVSNPLDLLIQLNPMLYVSLTNLYMA
jgi:hypothetical protein